MWLGQKENYHWLVSENPISNLLESVVEHHREMLLHVTSFDSGPLILTEREKELGWSRSGFVSISPPLESGLSIPHDQYDEWYLSTAPLEFPSSFEAFVNFCAFTLVHPSEITKNDALPWERVRMDFLPPLQEKFWKQLLTIQPETYIGMGEQDIFVSQDEAFIKLMRQRA
ncbi:MAG: hypothetical protein AAGA01_02800 [Cyanobacteria bacterium P01_E01_bin.43]